MTTQGSCGGGPATALRLDAAAAGPVQERTDNECHRSAPRSSSHRERRVLCYHQRTPRRCCSGLAGFRQINMRKGRWLENLATKLIDQQIDLAANQGRTSEISPLQIPTTSQTASAKRLQFHSSRDLSFWQWTRLIDSIRANHRLTFEIARFESSDEVSFRIMRILRSPCAGSRLGATAGGYRRREYPHASDIVYWL